MLRVGIAGYGFIGRMHFDAFSSLDDVIVTAVAARTNAPTGITRYSRPADMIRSDEVDAVVVALPTFMHADAASEALAAGKPVLVEKPLAVDPAEAEGLVAQVEATGVPLQVAQVLRYSAQPLELASRLQSPEFGDPVDLRFARECTAPDWSAWILDPQLSGGALHDLMIHDLDFVYSVYGLPHAVAARAHESVEGALDHVEITLTYSGAREFTVTVAGSWRMPTAYPFTATARCLGTGQVIETTNRSASAQIDQGGETSLSVFGTTVERIEYAPDPLAPFVAQAKSFIELTKDPTRHPNPGVHEARDVLSIVEAARTSISTGTSVSLAGR